MGIAGSRRLTAALVVAVLGLAVRGTSAQVFVVGEKTATADVVTEFHATHVSLSDMALDERGRQDLIRNLESEQGFAHRELPLGAGIELTANGNMSPRDEAYKKILYEKGQSAGPGDRVAISALQFKGDSIVIDLNGGPYAKNRFLSHISINNNQIAPLGPPATGCRITLYFEGGVPQISAAEIKSLLDPLIDFKAKSSVEAYANTLSPKVREAVQQHEVLVGMDRRMVLAALGSPLSKHREHVSGTDANSPVFEEWIYGQTPEPIQFVRFRGGHVVRLETAAIGKPLEVRETNETGEPVAPTLLARTIRNGDEVQVVGEDRAMSKPPTLLRPDETAAAHTGVGKVRMPVDVAKPIPASQPVFASQPVPATPGATQPLM